MKLYALCILFNCISFSVLAGGDKEEQPKEAQNELQSILHLLKQQDPFIESIFERISKLKENHEILDQEVTALEKPLTTEKSADSTTISSLNQHIEK
jgi:hypothetical protein